MTPSNGKGKCDTAAETRVLTTNCIYTEQYKMSQCATKCAIYSAKTIYIYSRNTKKLDVLQNVM